VDVIMEEALIRARDSINKLYISRRDKFIRQKSDGTYSHSDGFASKLVLTDTMIDNHLSDKETIGIFSPKGYSKFIAFDIDCKTYSEEFRREVVLFIKEAIINFGIDKEYIYTSISGNKGYHISIFLSNVTTHDNIYKFYESVLESTGLSSTMVELAPSHSNGIKIPLGTHMVTNRKCWFVDNTFNEINKIDYLSNANVLDRDYFQCLVSGIKPISEVASKLKVIYSEFSDYKIPFLTLEAVLKLEEVGLSQPSTRNYSSVQLAILYNTLNDTKDVALSKLNDWISRQDTKYYRTPINRCYHENEKIVNWVYTHNIRFKAKENDSVSLYKKEVEFVSSVKDRKARHILFSMLCHYKRYSSDNSKSFYMSYSQISKHTGIKNFKYIKLAIEILESSGSVSIIRKSEYNRDKKMFDVNIYELNMPISNKGNVLYEVVNYNDGYMNNKSVLDNLLIL
jgi:hypothetical protein